MQRSLYIHLNEVIGIAEDLDQNLLKRLWENSVSEMIRNGVHLCFTFHRVVTVGNGLWLGFIGERESWGKRGGGPQSPGINNIWIKCSELHCSLYLPTSHFFVFGNGRQSSLSTQHVDESQLRRADSLSQFVL